MNASLFKHLRPFVTRYLAISESAIPGSLTLYGAKDALDQLDQEYNAQNSRSPDRLVLANLTEPNQVTLWTVFALLLWGAKLALIISLINRVKGQK